MPQNIIEGIVTHFDPAGRRMTVLQVTRRRDGLSRLEIPFRIDPNILVSGMDRGILVLTDVKVGKKVRIRYVSRSGARRMAKTITVVQG